MTCCMADLQFLSFPLLGSVTESIQGGWVTMDAFGRTGRDEYGRKVLKLEPETLQSAAAPKDGGLLQGKRNPDLQKIRIKSGK